jgi:hypothetical protein
MGVRTFPEGDPSISLAERQLILDQLTDFIPFLVGQEGEDCTRASYSSPESAIVISAMPDQTPESDDFSAHVIVAEVLNEFGKVGTSSTYYIDKRAGHIDVEVDTSHYLLEPAPDGGWLSRVFPSERGQLVKLAMEANDETVTRVALELIDEIRWKKTALAQQTGAEDSFTRAQYRALMHALFSINPEDAIR